MDCLFHTDFFQIPSRLIGIRLLHSFQWAAPYSGPSISSKTGVSCLSITFYARVKTGKNPETGVAPLPEHRLCRLF